MGLRLRRRCPPTAVTSSTRGDCSLSSAVARSAGRRSARRPAAAGSEALGCDWHLGNGTAPGGASSRAASPRRCSRVGPTACPSGSVTTRHWRHILLGDEEVDELMEVYTAVAVYVDVVKAGHQLVVRHVWIHASEEAAQLMEIQRSVPIPVQSFELRRKLVHLGLVELVPGGLFELVPGRSGRRRRVRGSASSRRSGRCSSSTVGCCGRSHPAVAGSGGRGCTASGWSARCSTGE